MIHNSVKNIVTLAGAAAKFRKTYKLTAMH